MSAFLKMFLSAAERSHYVFTPSQWKKIIQEADKTTLLYIKNEVVGNWKSFTREDWIDSQHKKDILESLYTRLDDMNVTEWFKEMFLHIH